MFIDFDGAQAALRQEGHVCIALISAASPRSFGESDQ